MRTDDRDNAHLVPTSWCWFAALALMFLQFAVVLAAYRLSILTERFDGLSVQAEEATVRLKAVERDLAAVRRNIVGELPASPEPAPCQPQKDKR